MGETQCRTKTPRACALRDLNDGRTTAKSYIGAGFETDNGGVHLQILPLRGRAVGRARGRRGGTDGKSVVWQAYGASGVDILARPLAGGPVKVLWHTSRSVGSSTSVDGDTVAFPYCNYGGRPGVACPSMKDPANVVQIGGGTYHRSHFPSVSNGNVVHQDVQRVRAAVHEYSTRVVDIATGANTAVQRSTAVRASARRPSTTPTSSG
ncbi:hypothetical protein ACFWBX_29400 [Streptomyces sp. NPDC059991]|uniref:hypothetical protein n=1 Tax=Streptomyces sp. NPDC059991 TaxID=3347028 RepID=UPI0036BED783